MSVTSIQALHVKQTPEPTAIIHLTREMDPEVFHSVLGTVLKRIRAFAEKYDMEAKGKEIARAVECDFVRDTKDQEFFVLVAVRGPNVVGHLLAHLDYYYGTRLAYIHMNEINTAARISAEDSTLALALVNAWAKEKGAIKLKAAALTERHARRLEEEFGFKFGHITLEKEVV